MKRMYDRGLRSPDSAVIAAASEGYLNNFSGSVVDYVNRAEENSGEIRVKQKPQKEEEVLVEIVVARQETVEQFDYFAPENFFGPPVPAYVREMNKRGLIKLKSPYDDCESGSGGFHAKAW